MGSEELDVRIWLAEKWAWAKAHPWKAALYTVPFLVALPFIILALVRRSRGDAGRGVELSRAALEEKDRKLVEDMTSEIEEIEEDGKEEVFKAEETSKQRGLRATNQVIAERDAQAADGRALVEALREDGRKDRGL